MKEKVCRLNQEVGWGRLLPSNLGRWHLGISDVPRM